MINRLGFESFLKSPAIFDWIFELKPSRSPGWMKSCERNLPRSSLWLYNIPDYCRRGSEGCSPCLCCRPRPLQSPVWLSVPGLRIGQSTDTSPSHCDWSIKIILASDWMIQVTWPEYWPLIGWCTHLQCGLWAGQSELARHWRASTIIMWGEARRQSRGRMTLTTESPAILSGHAHRTQYQRSGACMVSRSLSRCTTHSGTKKNAWNNDKHKLKVELGFVTVKSLTCRLGSRCEDSFNVLGF